MKEMKKAPAWGLVVRRVLLAALVLTAGVMALAECQPQPEMHVEVAVQPTSEPDRRSVREAAYDKDVAALQALVESAETDESTRAQAARRLEKMIGEHQAEMAIEEALRQAGYAPKLVLMQNNALTVMLDGEVSSTVSASVLALCAAYTEVEAENVRIMGT